MSAARREAIAQALLAVLEGVSAATTVKRWRGTPFTEAELPAINMIDAGHDRTAQFSGQADFSLRVTLWLCVLESDDVTVGAALNALYAAVMAAVLADPTLAVAGVVQVEETGLGDPDVDERGAAPAVIAPLELQVEFQTAELDRTAAP